MPERKEAKVRLTPTQLRIAQAIGDNVYRERQRLGVSRKELAFMVQRSVTLITETENGRYYPSIKTLCEIADILDIDVFKLFER